MVLNLAPAEISQCQEQYLPANSLTSPIFLTSTLIIFFMLLTSIRMIVGVVSLIILAINFNFSGEYIPGNFFLDTLSIVKIWGGTVAKIGTSTDVATSGGSLK